MVNLNLDVPDRQDDEESISEKQKSFIKALLSEVDGAQLPEETLNELGKRQASAVIDQLESFKKQLAGEEELDTSKLKGVGLRETTSWLKWVARLAWALVILAVFLLLFTP